MSDDLNKKQPQDPTKINTHEDWELEYWSKKWGVTKDKIIQASKIVGNGTEKIKKQLGK